MKTTIDAESAKIASLSYRAAEKLSQRALAAKLQTTQGVIGALETGKIRSRRVALAIMQLVPTQAESVI